MFFVTMEMEKPYSLQIHNTLLLCAIMHILIKYFHKSKTTKYSFNFVAANYPIHDAKVWVTKQTA